MSNLSRTPARQSLPPTEALLRKAAEQFAAGEFWEAHETLEPLWLALVPDPGANRLRAIIQLAAALHKSRQSPPHPGARLEEGLRRILGRSRANWRQAAGALPAPEALDEAYRDAADQAESWARDAERARAERLRLPPAVDGVTLPLDTWAAAVEHALDAVSSGSGPKTRT